MDWKTLLAQAKKAVADGDLELARQLKEQATELKALEALDEPEQDAEGNNTVDELLAEVKSLKAQLEAEPAQKASGHLVVTEDETEKKAGKPFPSAGSIN